MTRSPPAPASSGRSSARWCWSALLPLVVSHYFLIGINRDSLETLEKKYLTRSAVQIADRPAEPSREQPPAADQDRRQHPGDAQGAAGRDRSVHLRRADRLDRGLPSRRTATCSRIRVAQSPRARAPRPMPAQLDAAVIAGDGPWPGRWPQAGSQSTGRIQHLTARNAAGDGHGRAGHRRRVHRYRHGRRRWSACAGSSTASARKAKGDVTAFLVDRDGRVLIHSEPPSTSSIRLLAT